MVRAKEKEMAKDSAMETDILHYHMDLETEMGLVRAKEKEMAKDLLSA
jgi:hypothetical protein